MSILLVPSPAPSDPELDRCTLPSDSSGWSKRQNKVSHPHNQVCLEKTGQYHLKISYAAHHRTLEGKEVSEKKCSR